MSHFDDLDDLFDCVCAGGLQLGTERRKGRRRIAGRQFINFSKILFAGRFQHPGGHPPNKVLPVFPLRIEYRHAQVPHAPRAADVG